LDDETLNCFTSGPDCFALTDSTCQNDEALTTGFPSTSPRHELRGMAAKTSSPLPPHKKNQQPDRDADDEQKNDATHNDRQPVDLL
jgi:hypothetical protein